MFARPIYTAFRVRHLRLRGWVFRCWVRAWGGQAGKRLLVDQGFHLRHPPGAGWDIGEGSYFGRGVILDVWPGARLSVGARCRVMQYATIAAQESVVIGADSQISECAAVRDADHGIDTDEKIMLAPLVVRPVSIGADAWIARAVSVLAGATIGDGAVIAANSVVKGSIPSRAVAAGAPAKVRRFR